MALQKTYLAKNEVRLKPFLAKKVVRPLPDQPDRRRRPCGVGLYQEYQYSMPCYIVATTGPDAVRNSTCYNKVDKRLIWSVHKGSPEQSTSSPEQSTHPIWHQSFNQYLLMLTGSLIRFYTELAFLVQSSQRIHRDFLYHVYLPHPRETIYLCKYWSLWRDCASHRLVWAFVYA